MKTLPIKIHEKIAVYDSEEKVVCHNSDYLLKFDFDAEWTEYKYKTAIVRYFKAPEGWLKHEIVFEGETCELPVIDKAAELYIGVFAGDIRTTTEAKIPCRLSALSMTGVPVDPPDNVYNQILKMLEELKAGEVSPEDIKAAVDKYFADNPIDPADLGAVSADQGAENADKILGIGEDGKVIPVDKPQGDVKTVAGVEPDASGNVPLTASDVGASPGVYYGSDEPPEGYEVWFDPNGSESEWLTAESIKTALGYTPANEEDVNSLSEEKVDKPTNGNGTPGQALLTNGDDTTYWGAVSNGGNGGGSAEGAVLYTPQTLTDEQKAQARKNIGMTEAPTKTSQLENDSNFVIASDVFDSTEQATFTNVLDSVTLTQGKYLMGEGVYSDYPNTNATSFEEYIPIPKNPTIRMSDILLSASSSVACIMLYKNDYSFFVRLKVGANQYYWDVIESTEAGDVKAFTLKNCGSAAYMRICVRTADIGENPAISINEEISYEQGYGDKLNSKVKVDFNQILNAPQKNCWSILPYEHLNIAYSRIVGRKPMNTVEHFRDVAENFNFNVLKVDVEPTLDNELICCHDKGFTFDANGKITGYDPNNSTLIRDVTAETCIKYTHPSGEHVCLIGDFLSICRQYGKVAFITIRERYMDVVIPKLLSELKKHNMVYSTIINSLTYDSLVEWRRHDTSIMTNYTLYADQPITTETIDKALSIGYCSHCGLGFTSSNNTPDTVCNFDYARERGVRLLQSTAYTEGSVENCYALGYDGCQIAYAWNPKNTE